MTKLSSQFVSDLHERIEHEFERCCEKLRSENEQLQDEVRLLKNTIQLQAKEIEKLKLQQSEPQQLEPQQPGLLQQQQQQQRRKQQSARSGSDLLSLAPAKSLISLTTSVSPKTDGDKYDGSNGYSANADLVAKTSTNSNSSSNTRLGIRTKPIFDNVLPTQYSDSEEELFPQSQSPTAKRTRRSSLRCEGGLSQSSIKLSPQRESSPMRNELGPARKVSKLNREDATRFDLLRGKLGEISKPELCLRQDSDAISKLVNVENNDEHWAKDVADEFADTVDQVKSGRDDGFESECFSENEGEISDSQKDYEAQELFTTLPTSQAPVSFPKELKTVLQKRQYLTEYITEKFVQDPNFKINLTNHPIKLISWDFSDFVPNENYKPGKLSQMIKRNGIMDERKFEQYKAFYKLPQDQNFEDKVLQIFDKFQSPPGFMKLGFPSTQELVERRKLVNARQEKRVRRRIKSCTKVEDGTQVGEYIFSLGILNSYVVLGRWFVE